VTTGRRTVLDILMVIMTVAFFGLAFALVSWLERV
jgi:hypothetical protein